MATRTVIELTDDLDGTKAEKTVAFSWEGAQYEIDLSKDNLQKFMKAIDPFVSHARKVGGRRTSGGRSAETKKEDLATIRAWARAHGHQVSDRGRISRDVRKAYEAAN